MKAFTPEVKEYKERKVLTVTSKGDPNLVSQPYMKALYKAAYHAKMKIYKPKGVIMSIGKLCAFWPNAHLEEKSKWVGIWGVEVPEYFKESDLIQMFPEIEVRLEIWPGGLFAEILHLGPYSEEGPTVEKLHTFIKKEGYRIVGEHEEQYLTKPDSKNQKTVIRYRVEKI